MSIAKTTCDQPMGTFIPLQQHALASQLLAARLCWGLRDQLVHRVDGPAELLPNGTVHQLVALDHVETLKRFRHDLDAARRATIRRGTKQCNQPGNKNKWMDRLAEGPVVAVVVAQQATAQRATQTGGLCR